MLGSNVGTKNGEISSGRKKKIQYTDYVTRQDAGTHATRVQGAEKEKFNDKQPRVVASEGKSDDCALP